IDENNNSNTNSNALHCIFNKDTKHWYFDNTNALIKLITATENMVLINKSLDSTPSINNPKFDYEEFMKEREQLKCQLTQITDQVSTLISPYSNLFKNNLSKSDSSVNVCSNSNLTFTPLNTITIQQD